MCHGSREPGRGHGAAASFPDIPPRSLDPWAVNHSPLVVDYLKINGPPQIIEEVREQIESAGEDDVLGGGDDSDDDPMTRKAIEIIRSTKRASTSNLQRKLSIGYNRAARIMDDLEDRGLVGPDVAGQGREILMDLWNLSLPIPCKR